MQSKKANKLIRKYLNQRTKRIHRKKMNLTIPEKIVIPLHIYQVWHSKELPNPISYSIDKIKETNPEFEHHLYDEKECRQFIQNNFSNRVLNAYDSVVPHALKADLWRYCMMYKNGGIYLDSKYYGIDGFKFIYLTGKEYFCSDLTKESGVVCNAIFICKPHNPKMLKAIEQFLKNTENKYYGSVDICIGPLMLTPFFNTFELKNVIVNKRKRYIIYKGHPILKFNEEYTKEKAQTSKHWSSYWRKKTLYIV